jgi:hypothetical protein
MGLVELCHTYTGIWKCLLYPTLQPNNCSITTKKWKRQVEGEKCKELVCLPCVKEHKWLKESVIINYWKKQFHKVTKCSVWMLFINHIRPTNIVNIIHIRVTAKSFG